MEVSADEFYELENIHEIIVRCYSRTERILELWNVIKEKARSLLKRI